MTEIRIRTRKDRLRRPESRWRPHIDHVGNESMPETCPRCGWPCTHLVRTYYDSPWNQHGGMCTACCNEAAAHFDRHEWPEDPNALPPPPTFTQTEFFDGGS